MTARTRSATAVIRAADAAGTEAGAARLREGGLVAFATETVYGLGADATRDDAVAAVFAAKARPDFNPLIVHFADAEAAGREAAFDDRARALAARFWPGPLTLVLPRGAGCRLSPLVSAGLGTVAVRVPAAAGAQALLRAAGLPIAAPSANRSGHISPTTAAHVAASLHDMDVLILDGGACTVGIESTVVDLSQQTPALLRPGGIARDAIEALCGPLAEPDDETGEDPRRAPGRIPRHYAPSTPLRKDAFQIKPGEAVLAFGPTLPEGAEAATLVLNLSVTGDLTEAAANLFAMLHALDAAGAAGIACAPVPMGGLGAAINDRLSRAAEPLPPPARKA